MSFSRKFLVCQDLAHAAFLDLFALEYMRDARGVQAAEWSGVYVRDDGAYGVEWESPLTELLGPIIDEETGAELLPVVAETIAIDTDGNRISDWNKLLPPDLEVVLP